MEPPNELTIQRLHALEGRFSFVCRELGRKLRLEAGSLEQALPLRADVLPTPLPTVPAREVELGYECLDSALFGLRSFDGFSSHAVFTQRHPQPQEK